MFPEQKQVKVYNNGKTYAQNIADGTFIPVKHIQNHKELMGRIDSLESLINSLVTKLSK